MEKNNYEILIMCDPKSNEEDVHTIVKNIFKNDLEKFEKQEYSNLAYKINKSLNAVYYLVKAKSDGDSVAEFTRVSNINRKLIWRYLSINLDSEKGLNRKAKPKKQFSVKRDFDRPDRGERRFDRRRPSNDENASTNSSSFAQDDANKSTTRVRREWTPKDKVDATSTDNKTETKTIRPRTPRTSSLTDSKDKKDIKTTTTRTPRKTSSSKE